MAANRPPGRPAGPPEDRRTCNVQIRLTRAEMDALGRLHEAARLDRGRYVPLAEIAREILLASEKMQRLLAEMPIDWEEPPPA